MTEPQKIADWLRTLHGKSRWQLKYEATALLLLSVNWIISADVYDDFLIFYGTDGADMERHKQLLMITIERVNDVNADELAHRLYHELTTAINETDTDTAAAQ